MSQLSEIADGLKDVKKEEFRQALMKIFIDKKIPFAYVEERKFIDFIRKLPSCCAKLPSKKDLIDKLLVDSVKLAMANSADELDQTQNKPTSIPAMFDDLITKTTRIIEEKTGKKLSDSTDVHTEDLFGVICDILTNTVV